MDNPIAPFKTFDPLPNSRRRRNLVGTHTKPVVLQGDGTHMRLQAGEVSYIELPHWLKRILGLVYPTAVRLTVPDPLPSYPLTLSYPHSL